MRDMRGKFVDIIDDQGFSGLVHRNYFHYFDLTVSIKRKFMRGRGHQVGGRFGAKTLISSLVLARYAFGTLMLFWRADEKLPRVHLESSQSRFNFYL